ncbi:putative porin [uncultured Lacinutrix sp.]|uniref:putative porin n=1 Tax=uncultured Lacinutrix sp. TaxID=574032 RepID=UPI002630F62E|nr:putative porin [uncultured Lacinutrix sp.]
MNKIIFTFFLICFVSITYAQTEPKRSLGKLNDTKSVSSSEEGSVRNDSLSRGKGKGVKNEKAKITDYLIITHKNDTTYLDTTLTIQKEYKYNYLRKDEFNLMPFANMGQTYNTLSEDFQSISLLPEFGARARHFNYMEIEDINYFHVPTPLTELMYKSAFEQGQLLDALFTVNTSKQFNFSIAYKGLRSLGNYQNNLTSTGNFRFTTSYKTKNKKYVANLHFVSQDLLNEENGGLTDESVTFFESGDKDFDDRGVLEVNFEDAESILRGKRFYLNHKYNVISNTDSLSNNNLNVTHIMSLKDKNYRFEQTTSNEIFGSSFKTTGLRDEVTLEEFSNQLQLNYSNSLIGDVQFNTTHTNYNYGYNKLVVLEGNTITNRLKGDILAVGGKYKKQIKGFNLKGELGVNVSGSFVGNFINAEASYKLNDDLSASAQINNNTAAPDYNKQLYQSDYTNYNWENQFNTVKTQQIAFNLKSKKIADITLDLTTINDHVYFGLDPVTNLVKPFQNDKSITYLRLKASKEIKYRNFALNNTVMYQNVQDENEVFNVPQVITRNTLYYSNHLFKKAMYLQTGVTLNYFTSYNMNGYDPVLAEFYTQNEQEYGGFPRLDFFVNAKIRQTRIYIKAEHFNAAFTGRDYYSAPNTPFRDFKVRFGLVWNFFM